MIGDTIKAKKKLRNLLGRSQYDLICAKVEKAEETNFTVNNIVYRVQNNALPWTKSGAIKSIEDLMNFVNGCLEVARTKKQN